MSLTGRLPSLFRSIHRVLSLGLLASLPGVALAQVAASYDASLGSLPQSQGWTYDVNVPSAVSVQLAGGVLSLDTTPFSNSACPVATQPQSGYWHVEPPPFDFGQGVVFEAEFHVIASEYGVNPCTGWPRPGFGFTVVDQAGHYYSVGIGSNAIFLANDPYQPFNSPAVVQTAFNATSGFHVYRLEVSAVGAALLVDGSTILSISTGSPSQASTVWIGDGTNWANSDVAIRRFSVRGGLCTVRNGNGINPLDFHCVTDPMIGQAWTTTFNAGSGTAATILVLGPGGPATGPLFGTGELLIALVPAPQLVVGTDPMTVALPNTPLLVGLHMATQGARLEVGAQGLDIVLLNAIDIVVGG